MNAKFTLTFGTQFNKNGQRIELAARDAGIACVCHTLAETFGGYTITRSFGGWLNANNELVEEEGRVITVIAAGLADDNALRIAAAKARGVARAICSVLEQSSVVFEVQTAGEYDVAFVTWES